MAEPTLHYRVLGPMAAERDGKPVKLGGTKPRAILALLLLNPGRVVSVDRIAEALWGDRGPDRPTATVQVHVANLRRALAPGAPSIETQQPGYVLSSNTDNLDMLRFDELISVARGWIAKLENFRAADLMRQAFELWRGRPFEDLVEEEFAASARTALEDRYLTAQEQHLELLAAMSMHADVISTADSLLRDNPLREGLWEQMMLALYRTGRQAEALNAYQRCRTKLDEDLGIEPTRTLQDLHGRILRQDSDLDQVAAPDIGQPGPDLQDVIDQSISLTFRADDIAAGHLELEDGTSVKLTRRTLIGRHPDCAVMLSDRAVSRRHAEVRQSASGYLLVDLGSFNGTLVDDEPVVSNRLLQDGDRIEIGPYALVFRYS